MSADQSHLPQRVGERRPGGRSARVRSAILDATIEALATTNYDDLRVDDIAARAGVNKTTVYRRWPTKADLVTAAALANSGRAIPVPDTGSLHADLRALARSVATSIGTEPGRHITRNLVAAALAADETADAMADFWSERLALTGLIVDRAIARGELDDSVDPTTIIETLIGALYVRLLMTGEPVDSNTADTVASIVHHGVTTRPEPRP
jgi:AcrR family transcriptional regulator